MGVLKADIDDLIMNTFGGFLGYVIYAFANKVFGKKLWWRHAMNISGSE